MALSIQILCTIVFLLQDWCVLVAMAASSCFKSPFAVKLTSQKFKLNTFDITKHPFLAQAILFFHSITNTLLDAQIVPMAGTLPRPILASLLDPQKEKLENIQQDPKVNQSYLLELKGQDKRRLMAEENLGGFIGFIEKLRETDMSSGGP